MTNPRLHPTAQAALDALAQGDAARWRALFAPEAELLDDGDPHDLEAFTASALGQERFTRIEHADEKGLRVEGQFHSDRWGDFCAYFRFQLAPDGKISRLEIGQA